MQTKSLQVDTSWRYIYALDPAKNAASVAIASNMKNEKWLSPDMWSSKDAVSIEELESGILTVTQAQIDAAILQHQFGVSKCLHDN